MATPHDALLWQIINRSFCSFKVKLGKEKVFCRNEHNVTGLCSKQACPLANSRYATIREDAGKAFLYVKTIERAHTPNRLWEKIEIPKNYEKALEFIDTQLEYFPKFLKHKNKQRLTKIHQYLNRLRKLRLADNEVVLTTVRKKEDRRNVTREAKALKAASISKTIERELLERLKDGVYTGIYNFPSQEYTNALEELEDDDEDAPIQSEIVEGDYYEDDEDDDIEDLGDMLPMRKRRHMEIEYEDEGVELLEGRPV